MYDIQKVREDFPIDVYKRQIEAYEEVEVKQTL